MKPITNGCMLLAIWLISTIAVHAQSPAKTNSNSQNAEMKTFVIEREIPDAGKLTAEQLKAISQKSCGVLQQMGPQIQWIHSYVTGNKIYCIYKAENGYEVEGQVNQVCFIEGLVPFKGRWYLYYGTADSKIAVAVMN